MRRLAIAGGLLVLLAGIGSAADLPMREVTLYKHGVGFFARAGRLAPGETARLEFRAEDMNDVLKSLTLTDRQGGKVGGVRYDASDPLEERLKEFPFAIGNGLPLAAFLDQLKGARIEVKLAGETATGTIVGATLLRASDKDHADRESLILLTNSGDLRTIDLGAASSVKLVDAKQQALLRDYLGVLDQSRSKDRRSVYIDAVGGGARDLVAAYMAPAPVWKSSYRLLFPPQGDPTLEGWAIVDNTTGEDWIDVRLAVVSGRPISFVTPLYEPRYLARPTAELAENEAAVPRVFGQAMEALPAPKPAPAPMSLGAGALASGPRMEARLARPRKAAEDEQPEEAPEPMEVGTSTVTGEAKGRTTGELFEYSFAMPVTVKKGESAMLPFVQQKLTARKLLIYLESFGLNPQNAAELVNSTGKTLDGGPITVYDAGTYAGEALVETVKAGDKRLISYGIDLGTRITTARGSSKMIVREMHLRQGILTTRVAAEEVKTYTIRNVDPKPKTLLVEHPLRSGYKLLEPKAPQETTADAYRFEVKLPATGGAALAVREERVYDQTASVVNLTPNVLMAYVENKALSPAGQRQLGQIAAKKREIVSTDEAIKQTDAGIATLSQDQDRLRRNIDSLRNVAGQGELVQQYARTLGANEVKIASLRDKQSEQRKKKAVLEAELNGLIEKAEF